MSIYDEELRRRLARGDDPEEVARWYIDRTIESKLRWKDLTVFEVRFWKRIDRAYTRWNWRRRMNQR